MWKHRLKVKEVRNREISESSERNRRASHGCIPIAGPVNNTCSLLSRLSRFQSSRSYVGADLIAVRLHGTR
jgi:hypothetical protein